MNGRFSWLIYGEFLMLSHELFCMVSQTGDQIGGVWGCHSNRVGETTKMMGTYCYRHMYIHYIYIYISAMMLATILQRFISKFWDGASMSRTLWLLVEATSPNSSLAAKITVFWDAVHDCAAPPAQP